MQWNYSITNLPSLDIEVGNQLLVAGNNDFFFSSLQLRRIKEQRELFHTAFTHNHRGASVKRAYYGIWKMIPNYHDLLSVNCLSKVYTAIVKIVFLERKFP